MFKFSVVKSGVIALGLALAVSVGAFGITGLGLMTASGKALWLALFVSLIVWCALFLYHIVSDFGGFDVISDSLSRLIKDDFTAFLLMSWLFTGLLQGIAGFGVPAVIAAPLLIKRGFPPVKSLCAVLIGHCWAITFGSMASGFYVIHNLT
ncbi:MAG: L-lactate permease, partial [Oscillospiraceae bacterium]|nr:L-lactate permease [Oscillospiraceae bacterium]